MCERLDGEWEMVCVCVCVCERERERERDWRRSPQNRFEPWPVLEKVLSEIKNSSSSTFLIPSFDEKRFFFFFSEKKEIISDHLFFTNVKKNLSLSKNSSSSPFELDEIFAFKIPRWRCAMNGHDDELGPMRLPYSALQPDGYHYKSTISIGYVIRIIT